MKRTASILILFLSITNLFAQSEKINFKTFEKDYMVEILPEGQKKTLNDFAGTKGPQDIFAYSIGKYEVTQELYQEVMGRNPSEFKGPKLPVEQVT